ncbi:1-deoxy-D-xylulose-5-phosphate synthase N-terminal domain-containing protein [Micromonospora sp. NPDC048835]|uniref:1-deoxy-D-xylulose-5-phosphate synthase N-terminal domain-containing protein n=1 Tax=Micromonospora sp. NPDC048835 TaxID=3155147 RepID=UPI00340E2077
MTVSTLRSGDAGATSDTDLSARARHARRLAVRMAAGPTGCHLGGSLSVIDILVAAIDFVSGVPESEVVLSKGHAAAGLYAALHASGILPEDPSEQYGRDGSPFTGHPNPALRGIRFPTGSLGHGLAYAVGWSMACRLRANGGTAVAVVGDGELQEGLTWEACQVAAAQRLGNLIVVVDRNGYQNDGAVDDISAMPHLADRFRAFGFAAVEVDGHDLTQLSETLAAHDTRGDRPLAVIARTMKAKGIAELEGRAGSHYVTASPEQAHRWTQALR